jgi:hypothetical protein
MLYTYADYIREDDRAAPNLARPVADNQRRGAREPGFCLLRGQRSRPASNLLCAVLCRWFVGEPPHVLTCCDDPIAPIGSGFPIRCVGRQGV